MPDDWEQLDDAYLETFGTRPDLPPLHHAYTGWNRKDVEVEVEDGGETASCGRGIGPGAA